MNEHYIYAALLFVVGILVSATAIIFLTRVSNKILHFFQLYPESKTILKLSLKFISWFVGFLCFLIFLRLALLQLGLEFTKNFIETVILQSSKYILAVLIILGGFYVSRIVKERFQTYTFEYKDRMMFFVDVIIHMTFILTALYAVGINIVVFLELYKVIIWTVGLIIALTISMMIGIPLGINIYDSMKQKKNISSPKKPKHVKKS